MSNTLNLNLEKPDYASLNWDTPLNSNFDKLDIAIMNIINVKAYGAKGDGSTDDSVAIQAAYTACPTGGTLYFPQGTYIWDFELIINKSITLKGFQAIIKLPDNSNLFNDSTNTYGRYMIHIRASDVVIDGLIFNGNSPNNYKTVLGVKYYYYGTGGLWMVSMIMVGFYGAGVTPADLYNIMIKNCAFKDSPDHCIDSVNSDALGKKIYGLKVTNNYFLHGQGIGVALSDCNGAIVSGNIFINSYDFSIQLYSISKDCVVCNNTIRFKTSEITIAEVDPVVNHTAGVMKWFGQIRVGKSNVAWNKGHIISNNTLEGAMIQVTSGVAYSTISNNVVIESEAQGINYQANADSIGDATSQYDVTNPAGTTFRYTYDGTGTDPLIVAGNPVIGSRLYVTGGTWNAGNKGYFDIIGVGANYIEVNNAAGVAENNVTGILRWGHNMGNKIMGNLIYKCAQSGMYLADTICETDVTDNILIGNNISTDQYGGRDCFTNIFILSDFWHLKRNFLRKFGTKPIYGVRYYSGVTTTYFVFSDNDILGSGNTADFYDEDGTKSVSELQFANLPTYANNAAAVAGFLKVGAFYRTNGDPDTVCVVH